ncbi:uncharacterized protein LOC117648193 [Thrips palmi]|uniref:Uncharacterized protein LOC117648193 n=1 Tax=Thrips palmi TaxID=161013 RepID=A0A6P8Z1Q3_THRPL|nr:uncharacterized protein LOC117648193 [Thrips palmi]
MPPKQGPRCRVLGCTYSKKPVPPGTSLFLVPNFTDDKVKNVVVFESWVQLSGNNEHLEIPIKHLRRNMKFCERHFLPDQFQAGGRRGKKLKKKETLPSVFDEHHAPISDEHMSQWRQTQHYRAIFEPLTPRRKAASEKVVVEPPVNQVQHYCNLVS